AHEWLITPLYEIFGSEELSALAPAVAERVPSTYLLLGPEDAARLGATDGTVVEVKFAGAAYRLDVRLQDSLAAGVAGFLTGLPGSAAVALPVWATIGMLGHE
ncbi:MAG: NADH-quinone oxidoreductase subunit NuoG, partial [Steroidobacteraceae bacterium]